MPSGRIGRNQNMSIPYEPERYESIFEFELRSDENVDVCIVNADELDDFYLHGPSEFSIPRRRASLRRKQHHLEAICPAGQRVFALVVNRSRVLDTDVFYEMLVGANQSLIVDTEGSKTTALLFAAACWLGLGI